MKVKPSRKSGLALLLAALLLFQLAACAQNREPNESQSNPPPAQETVPGETPQSTETAAGETRLFTDSTGRVVELPVTITKVASGGSLANIMLYATRPEVIVGWSQSPSEREKTYIDPKYWDLPEYGNFHDAGGSFNREALMSSAPEVIVDVGQWDDGYKADLDALQEQLGIPVVLVESNLLEQTPDAYRMMGELLGVPERGEELAAYCEDILTDAKERAAKIPEAEQKTVFYASGNDGLSTMLEGTIHAQVYNLVGSHLAARSDDATLQQGGGTVSMEQLLVWDPDVILFVTGSIYDQVAEDPSWQALTAIQNGAYYEVPIEPYNWISRPPGPNRMTGIRWLGNLLYPDIFDYDMVQETKDSFRMFFRYDLSDEEAARLLERSTGKLP